MWLETCWRRTSAIRSSPLPPSPPLTLTPPLTLPPETDNICRGLTMQDSRPRRRQKNGAPQGGTGGPSGRKEELPHSAFHMPHRNIGLHLLTFSLKSSPIGAQLILRWLTTARIYLVTAAMRCLSQRSRLTKSPGHSNWQLLRTTLKVVVSRPTEGA